jgi:hypothetical protein
MALRLAPPESVLRPEYQISASVFSYNFSVLPGSCGDFFIEWKTPQSRLFAGGEASPLRMASGGNASEGSKLVAATRPPPTN